VDNTSARTVTPSVYVSSTGLGGRLKIDGRVMYSFIRRKGGNNGVLFQALSRNPTWPVYDSTDVDHGGYYTVTTASGEPNPVAMIREQQNNVEAQLFTGDVAASYKLFNHLKLRIHYSFNSQQNYSGTYQTKYYPDLGTNGNATVSTVLTHDKLFEPGIEFDKTAGGSSIQAMGGYSYYENTTEGLTDNNYDFDVDDFSYNNIGAGYALDQGLATMNSSKASNKLISFYGRVLYNYQQKYLLSLSARYEGSSRFGTNNKWGLFPAISAGWRISEENFARNISWLSNLKLRAGYGVTGNQDIPDYQSLSRIGISSREFYYNGGWINTYEPSSNPNPDLKWEKKGEFDAGVDFGLLAGRITGSFDYYYRKISDLLWNYAVPVPPNVYPTTYANVGVMENHGIEISLTAKVVQTGAFRWSSTLLYSRNRNELVAFSDAARGYKLDFLEIDPVAGTWSQLVREHEPIGNFMAPVYLGVDNNGNAVYKDVNGDGKISTGSQEDREVVGNAYPKFEMGWTNQMRYKDFDLSFFFRGVFGQSLLNYERVFFENWQPFLAGTNILSSTLSNPKYTGVQTYDSRFVEKASYVKLSSLQLGYNLKVDGQDPLRIYASCQNLFTITNYKGSDPEAPIPDFTTNIGPAGTENLNYYPYTITFLLGIDFNF
jgi:TonB-linked SusC/RagA family outer membrane protein